MIDLGDVSTLRCLVLDDADDPIDPTTLDLTITAPDGTVTNVAKAGLTNVSLGSYRYGLVLSQVGVWRYTFDAGGNVEQSESGLIVVGASTPGIAAWCSVDDLFACSSCRGLTLPDEGIAARSVVAASEFLYAKTGRRWPGMFLDTVRPCARPTCEEPLGRHACGCSSLSEVELPGVVQGVVEVLVDGAVLLASEYAVRDRKRLLRLNDETWPCCQDLTLAATEADTWEVTYARGEEPPELGVLAAAELACEFYLAFVGSGDCKLPKQVQSISRQGVNVAFISPPDFGAGRLGLPIVDAFLAAHGTGTRRGGAHIAGPDRPSGVTRIG